MMAIPAFFRMLFGRVRTHAVDSFDAFRTQIDKTGLFPDLKGKAGIALRRQVIEDGQLAKSYMLMCGLSAGIAALGLLQSSTAVVIGAMLISPLMGPIASMGFGFASFDGRQIRDGAKVIAIGAAIGILISMLLTWLSPIRNATPEIIARTEPTLLDLAIAIFSGTAGAYATVHQKGATAIGVAIATALMPPLAVVGYSIGVGNMAFAAGSILLFLTNLAAISFSFAAVARFSGACRPISLVEITPRFVAAGLTGFAVLAVPLGITLYRVTAEAQAQTTVRELIRQELGGSKVNIAQLQVKWPMRGVPTVDAVVVTRAYTRDAESHILARLEREWGRKPELNLQQVVAADFKAQTAAIVDAALQRSAAGIANDTPPLGDIRDAIGLPTQSVLVNRGERNVQILPYAADGWTLGDFRKLEKAATRAGGGWKVFLIPPIQPRLFVPIETGEDGRLKKTPEFDDAIWAADRWDVQGITIAGIVSGNDTDEEKQAAQKLAELSSAELKASGIRARPAVLDADAEGGLPSGVTGVQFLIVRPPPPPPEPAQGEAGTPQAATAQ